jgi:ribose-phosphate pyrophosphokinase
MITYQIGSTRYQPKVWKFPAGEVGASVLSHNASDKVALVNIIASIQNSDEVMQLLMLTDAIKRTFMNAKIRLRLGYIPYARQDRVCVDGESLSIAVFAALINSQGYDSVLLIDPHSDVATALFNRVEIVQQKDVYLKFLRSHAPFGMIVAPDVGAAKKAASIASVLPMEVVYASKTRNLNTGEITALSFSGNVAGCDVIVIDDICDGGATFLKLGSQLIGAGVKQMDLFVTHGLFTKGTEELTRLYNNVYTTNSYHQDREGLVDGVEYFKII